MTPEREEQIWQRLNIEYRKLASCVIARDDFEVEVEEHAERLRKVLENEVDAEAIVDVRIREKARYFGEACTNAREEIRRQLLDECGDDEKARAKVKVTDKAVEQQVRADRHYVQVCLDLTDAERMQRRWEKLGKAYMERGRRMDNLTRIYLSEQGRNFKTAGPGPDESTRVDRPGLDLPRTNVRVQDPEPAYQEAQTPERRTRRRRASDVQ